MGELANMSGEAASRSSLDLPGRQEELLRAVVGARQARRARADRTAGRSSIGWAAENVPAILEAWQPGTEGGHAVADVLFGDVNPGGKLPGHLPAQRRPRAALLRAQPDAPARGLADVQRRATGTGPTTPLYPFGFGLSYTTFAYSNLKLDAPQLKLGAAATVSVDVTNTGAVAGDEVVQLYVHQKAGSDSRPVRELKGFKRVGAQAGRDADDHASRSAPTSCATGARPRSAGCRTPRRSTSGSAATRRPTLHAELSGRTVGPRGGIP